MPTNTYPHKDAISIGFGPAGISLACVLADARENGEPLGALNMHFFDRAGEPSWHPELLLDHADINHHVFRDLVTPRNPRSRFSFAMYLKCRDRMFDFGLLGRPASRHEWSDYVAWVAEQVSGNTTYGAPVTDIEPIVDGQRLVAAKVVTPKATLETRNLVLSSGSLPHIPDMYRPLLGKRVFHTAHFLSSLRALGDDLPRRWLVIGSGQSASESIIELLGRRRDVLVHSIHRSGGFRLTQLGQFPNQVFSPQHVDYFHRLSTDARRQFLAWSRSTNYAGIDPDESVKLFSIVYEDALKGRERLVVHPYRDVETIEPVGDGYRVSLRDVFGGEEDNVEVDAVLLATGFEQPLVPPLLAGLQPWLRHDVDGGLCIDRDYRIATTDNSDVALYSNGLSERTHGVSDGLSFSLMALRAERIARGVAESVARHRAEP